MCSTLNSRLEEEISLLKEKEKYKYKITGNSEAIINLKEHFWFECLVLMFQKEVAERIISKPNSKEYGIISVKTQLLYDVKILFDVSPNVFFPKPRVNSSVISMTRKKNININFDLKLFDRLVKLSFQQRRKKIKTYSFYSANRHLTSDFCHLKKRCPAFPIL